MRRRDARAPPRPRRDRPVRARRRRPPRCRRRAGDARCSARQPMRLAEAPFAGQQRMGQQAPSASSTGIGPNFMPRLSLGVAAPRERKRLDDLRQHRDGDLGRDCGADVEPDRRVDAGDLVRTRAGIASRRSTRLRMRLAAAERADIEAAGLERRLQREIVDLRIMGERGQRGIGIERPVASARSSGHSAMQRRRRESAPASRRRCADR